ncbi:Tripeptidyl-peptidase sed2 [Elasticomyces elasticus]|uniref:Tripeptidyl-peptidase sed2 n=1 Tax=Exophiala sideris TaxID=1016849 RepID=A0ABR0JG33_9EURO|nr:Tripeptidyl-peptidase sed2 [Elasticomyces elasticus]KAK5025669.1 Tripeptidyl-peptidase sed2 [Exophiala sideris]KAK5033122.1 Tripeptidyl-peptidase sed2 [Exophiala sideris]KAK5063607.1 Tripeptidyl-peptidase sed2 [Exophiala sideris]KAK5180560.1 Tripeptidyl-peptidase sed2 [Eurotiomycetes sp. CCFEE 6388]
MVSFKLFLLLCSCAGLVLSLLDDASEIVESLTGTPRGWTQIGEPAGDQGLVLQVAMAQPLLAEFHQLIDKISTPGHPSYGNHLTKREVDVWTQPASEASDQIITWLKSEGVVEDNIKVSGHWIKFNVTVSTANALLDTKFYYYRQKDTTVIRTLQYSVPFNLRNMIETIQPTTRFGSPKLQIRLDSDEQPLQISSSTLTTYNETFCNTTVTPACIRGLYQMSEFTPSANDTMLGISGFDGQVYYVDDLNMFISNLNPYLMGSLNITSINGGIANAEFNVNTSAEGNLDVQYAAALTGGTPITYYSTGGQAPIDPDLDQPLAANGTNEPYLNQLQYLIGLDDSMLPGVLSTSYGEDEASVPYNYAVQVCNLFAQLTARGVSIIFSSGDTGVGSACRSNDGKNTLQFSPSFPATCPFVTAVGGTYGVNPEIAADFTSGGFSNYFPRPSWQDDTIYDYLVNLGDTNQGYFNATGRAYPDVAAQSVRYLVWNDGEPDFVWGTSCAAPTFAAIISNLNSIRIKQGMPRLGFLNPWLYSSGNQGFTDITLGASRGCSGVDIYTSQPAGKIENASWAAGSGWDPVSGWGTPVFAQLATMMT